MLNNALFGMLGAIFVILEGILTENIDKRVGKMVEMLPDAGAVSVVLLKELKPSTLLSCAHQCLANQECQYVAFCVANALCLLYQAASMLTGSITLPNGCKTLYKLGGGPELSVKSVAGGKNCIQSTTTAGGVCSRAIDGDPNTDFGGLSCTHTATEINPWWSVDLGRPYLVFEVTVVNRNNVPARLDNFDIRVGNSLVDNGNKNEICVSGIRHELPRTRTFRCVRYRIGRYVNIQIINPAGTLTLCEVIVHCHGVA